MKTYLRNTDPQCWRCRTPMNDTQIASLTYGEIIELIQRLTEELQIRYMSETNITR